MEERFCGRCGLACFVFGCVAFRFSDLDAGECGAGSVQRLVQVVLRRPHPTQLVKLAVPGLNVQ